MQRSYLMTTKDQQPTTIDEVLQWMWNGAIDFATSEDFKGYSGEAKDAIHDTYIDAVKAASQAALSAMVDKAVGDNWDGSKHPEKGGYNAAKDEVRKSLTALGFQLPNKEER